jgi:hypothetical protein
MTTPVKVVRDVNRGMIGFDLLLGTGAIVNPDLTLKLIGHDPPSDDARVLFRRCGPIWLTFAAAHLMAARRGNSRDWWAVAWLRGTEIATDVLWSGSPAVRRPHSRLSLRLAGVFNLALAVGAAHVAREVEREGG